MPDDALRRLLGAIRAHQPRTEPLVVALDGRSGTGKSTLAARCRAALPSCAVVDGDSFYAGGTPAEWDARSPAARAARVIDWRRQRPVLESLRARRPASWHGYDWDAFDGRLEVEATWVSPADVVVLEGVYSARPELADLLDIRVLVTADDAERARRIRERDGSDWDDGWAQRWASAEDHYFSTTVPADGFDLVL